MLTKLLKLDEERVSGLRLLLREGGMVIFPFYPFQPSVALRIETINFICTANQVTGFYVECRKGETSFLEVCLLNIVVNSRREKQMLWKKGCRG